MIPRKRPRRQRYSAPLPAVALGEQCRSIVQRRETNVLPADHPPRVAVADERIYLAALVSEAARFLESESDQGVRSPVVAGCQSDPVQSQAGLYRPGIRRTTSLEDAGEVPLGSGKSYLRRETEPRPSAAARSAREESRASALDQRARTTSALSSLTARSAACTTARAAPSSDCAAAGVQKVSSAAQRRCIQEHHAARRRRASRRASATIATAAATASHRRPDGSAGVVSATRASGSPTTVKPAQSPGGAPGRWLEASRIGARPPRAFRSRAPRKNPRPN